MSECLDLRNLARELEDLQDRHDDPEADPLDDDELDRLNALLKLEKDLGDELIDAARNEPTLIPEDRWVEYWKEYAEDAGYCSKNNPLSDHIDWKSWADEALCDYTEVEFEGVTYYYRS